MSYCKKCGEKLDKDNKFCPNCGTPNPVFEVKAEDKDEGKIEGQKTVKKGSHIYGKINLENLPEGYVIDDRYEVKEKLGQGGFGAVYRVFDKKMEIEKALKVIPQAITNDEEAMLDLQNESRTMISLNHPNIVRVYDFHDEGSIKYIDMEYVDGKTLTRIKIEQPNKQLPEKEVKKYAIKIAEGLAYAHSKGIIHKDIKPQNVMLTDDGVVKIMDFGIAETVRTSMSRIQNTSSGTLVYMSPEQIKGKDVGKESDIYSFGAMLYELLSAHPPFYKGDINYQIMNEKPKLIPGISEKMNKVVLKCLEKNYKNRFHNFEFLIDTSNKEYQDKLLKKGLNAFELGDYEEALKLYSLILEMDPENIEVLHHRIKINYKLCALNGEENIADEIKSDCNVLLKINKDNALAKAYLGISYAIQKRKDFDKALELCDEAIKSQNNAELYYIRSEIYELMEKPEKQLADLQKALTIGTNNNHLLAEIEFSKLSLNIWKKEPEHIFKELDKLERFGLKDINFKMARNMMKAQAYYFMNQYDSSLIEISKIIEHTKKFRKIHATTILFRGMNYVGKEKIESALVDINYALENGLSEKYALAIAYYFRAACHISKEEYNTVLIDLNRAIELDALDEEMLANAHLLKGKYYCFNEDYERAYSQLMKSKSLNPNDSYVYMWLAVCYYQKQDSHNALINIKKAVDYDPTNEEAQNFLSELENEISDSTNSEDECYIATMVYKDKYAEKVCILRNFRDKYLLNSRVGRNFVKFYYKYSPHWVEKLYNKNLISLIIKKHLDFMTYLIILFGHKKD